MALKELNLFVSFYRHYRTIKKFADLSEEHKNASLSPDRFVADLISLGPLFIKLGQILSTRPDILPHQYIKKLEKLHENVPAFEFTQVKEIVEEELGRPIAEIFQTLAEKPEAAASLAQVHFAVLQSGVKVALKIQRPEVKQLIDRDFKLLERVLRILKLLFPRKLKRSNLEEGFNEFKRYTLQELDFAHEANVIERFKANFQGWDDITFPKIYWDYTTSRILAMERLSGMRLSEALLKLSQDEKKRLNTRLAEMELKMFISDGLFHADLHPGNIFFKEDGKIVLLDFGMYGELNEEERNRFVLYWMAVSQNQVNRAFYYFRKQCRQHPGADEKAFFNRFKELADRFYHSRLIDTSITEVYINMIEAGYQYGYVFPSNLLLHAKALTTAEALTFELDPNIRYEAITRPIISREFARLAMSSTRIRSLIEQQLPELILMGTLPGNIANEASLENKSESLWSDLYKQMVVNLKNLSSNGGVFRHILNPPARRILRQYFDEEVMDQVLAKAWMEYPRLEADLPKQQTLGASITLHLAAATIAFYNSLLAAGETKEKATDLIYRIGWEVYKKMSEIPMLIAGLFSDDPNKRMEIATQVFRQFPFSAPDYVWEDVRNESGTVAFNCTCCHVANLFIKHGIGDVCYHTWCKLDFPLAEKWGGKLVRSNSIAGGAQVCDFQFKVESN